MFSSPAKPALAAPARPRDYLQPKSPNARVNTAGTVTPRTAPAGRSPTRTSKRIGILSNSRRRFLAPPSFGLGSAAPFSLDAALKGTIPSYGGANLDTSSPSVLAMPSSDLFLACGSSKAASWVFDIHEDTPEQEMTNLLQHSTCTLDISSDDECAQRARRERVEGKENIPPPDDVSQTTTEVRRGARLTAGGMEVEKPRGPLAEMDVADYLPDGVDLNAVVLVPAGEDAGPVEDADADGDGVVFGPPEPAIEDMSGFQQPPPSIAEVMDMAQAATKAVVLQPLEGTGESFDLWESGSATAEGDVAPAEAAVVEAVAAVGA